MGSFDVNYDVLRVQLLPVRLRKDRMKAWIKCLISPVKYLYDLYKLFRAAKLYDLAHNSQVCYMEAALNDVFDPEARRIYISDGEYEVPTFVYTVPEERTLYLATDGELPLIDYDAPIYLNLDSETYVMGWQFIVYYPAGLVFDMARLKAIVNRYRLPSKKNYDVREF